MTAVTLLLMVAMAQATALQPPQSAAARVIDALQKGDLKNKALAVDAIPRSAELRQDPAVQETLLQELEKTATAVDQAEPASESLGEYKLALVRAAASLSTPKVLPYLIPQVATDGVAVKAIARFGDSAIEPLLQAYAGADTAKRPRLMRSGVLDTLALVVRQPGVTLEHRQRCEQLASQELASAQGWDVLAGAVRLAAATGNPELIGQVGRIAQGETRSGIAPADMERVRKVASRVVSKTPGMPR